MDYSTLRLDPQGVRSKLIVQSNGAMITTAPLRVVFPKHYVEGSLGSIDGTINVVGFIAFIIGDMYECETVPSIMRFVAEETNVVSYDGSPYMELSWDAGSVVCDNVDLVQQDLLLFLLYDEIVAKGRIPWYMGLTHQAFMFDMAEYYTGTDLRANHMIYENTVASRARVVGKRSKYWRETLVKQSDFYTMPVDIIPQRSVAYGATNTNARLAGSHFSEGSNSALVNPSVKSENIEEILRR